MHEHDPEAAGALGGGGEDEFTLAHRQRRAAHEPRHRRPADQGDDHDDAIEAYVFVLGQRRRQAELVEVDRRQHDQERQQRQGDHAVGQAHQQGVQPAAVIARPEADDGADDGGDEGGDEADEERHLAAIEQAQEEIAPQLVGAERMAERGALEAVEQIDRLGVDAACRLDQGRRHGQRGKDDEQEPARHRQMVIEEAAPQQPPERARRPRLPTAAIRVSAYQPRRHDAAPVFL